LIERVCTAYLSTCFQRRARSERVIQYNDKQVKSVIFLSRYLFISRRPFFCRAHDDHFILYLNMNLISDMHAELLQRVFGKGYCCRRANFENFLNHDAIIMTAKDVWSF